MIPQWERLLCRQQPPPPGAASTGIGGTGGVRGRFLVVHPTDCKAGTASLYDVMIVVDFLDDLRNGWGSDRLLVEEVLASAVSELSGGA